MNGMGEGGRKGVRERVEGILHYLPYLILPWPRFSDYLRLESENPRKPIVLAFDEDNSPLGGEVRVHVYHMTYTVMNVPHARMCTLTHTSNHVHTQQFICMYKLALTDRNDLTCASTMLYFSTETGVCMSPIGKE